MLSEPALSLTDLALGVVALGCWRYVRRASGASRHWANVFAWAALAALAGFVHHGWVTFSPRAAGPSWAVISGIVVVTVSYLLAASVEEVLGPGRFGAFVVLRSLSVAAYAVVALLGHAGVAAIMACESLTMGAVVVLWLRGLWNAHPLAPAVASALAASMFAGLVRGLPAAWADAVGSNPETLYHVAQIPGLVMLAYAVRPVRGRDTRAAPYTRRERNPGGRVHG